MIAPYLNARSFQSLPCLALFAQYDRPIMRLLLLTTFFLAACTTVPELDARISETARAAEYPSLQPIDQVLTSDRTPVLDDQAVSAFQGRIARLKARAARLRRTPVVDSTSRARLHQAIRG